MGPSFQTVRSPRYEGLYMRHIDSLTVNFDAGPSWSGLMPISANPKETRKLFFWYVPYQYIYTCHKVDRNLGFGLRLTRQTRGILSSGRTVRLQF